MIGARFGFLFICLAEYKYRSRGAHVVPQAKTYMINHFDTMEEYEAHMAKLELAENAAHASRPFLGQIHVENVALTEVMRFEFDRILPSIKTIFDGDEYLYKQLSKK